MKTSEALNLIVRVEKSFDTSIITWNGLSTWPLLRKILWLKLISVNPTKTIEKPSTIFFNFIKLIASSIYQKFKITKLNKDSEKIFFSRPEYLQIINSDRYVDRIVDPIIESFSSSFSVTKYYFSNISNKKKLIHDYSKFHHDVYIGIINLSQKEKRFLFEIQRFLKIDCLQLEKSYKKELRTFIGWYLSAKKVFKKNENLKEVYISCWYYPETMAICAAADELGIKSIDIQHGKQGKFQAMYSGWTKIPENGYALMPDRFWCWGKPSCDHILASSPKRKKHIPFIGGYPWIDYYKKNISTHNQKNSEKKIRVLVTLQSIQGSNTQRIPDFFIEFLSNCNEEDIEFIFRLHPNDKEGYAYCNERLKLVNPVLYSIDTGVQNLYDVLKVVSHHVTAFSSCCYEASIFNVPTLLYGEESKEIYEDDIKNHIFTWVNSNEESLRAWLHSDSYNKPNTAMPYIDKIDK